MQIDKKNILKLIFLFLFLFIVAVRPTSAAVNIEECKTCHAIVKPLVIITKDCMQCHQGHSGGSPSTRDPTDVHEIHETVDEGKIPYCKNCHTSPVDCKNCHNSHEITNLSSSIVTINVNNTNNANIINNYSLCKNCHGPLPTPYGHKDFRDALKISKHNWMDCQTCHVPPFKDSNSINLHFKDLIGTPITSSINLCKICHSTEYKGLTKGTHGSLNNTCIDCHNPHTTSIGNVRNIGNELLPKATSTPQTNLSSTIDSTTNWLTQKIPILNNPFAVAIMLILMAVTVAEYLLSKHDEGKKVAYKMVRIQADENTLKTLEVKLDNQNINLINDILKENGIDVLGMTMTKETNLYDYIIFVDIRRKEESEGITLIEKISKEISSLTEVISVEITDRYEL